MNLLELLWDEEQNMQYWTKKIAHFKSFTLEKTTKSIRIIIGGLESYDPSYLMVLTESKARECLNSVIKPIEKRLGRKVQVGEKILESGWHLETNDPDSKAILNMFPGKVVTSELDKEKELKIQRDRSKFGQDLAIYSKDHDGVAEYIKDHDSMPIYTKKTLMIITQLAELTTSITSDLSSIKESQKALVGIEKEKLALTQTKMELEIVKEKKQNLAGYS